LSAAIHEASWTSTPDRIAQVDRGSLVGESEGYSFLLLNNIEFWLKIEHMMMGWLGRIGSRHTVEFNER
jgi:hypothetical protein